MEKCIYAILILCSMVFFGHYATKIVEYFLKKRSQRFKNDESEFYSDLYKVQIKWAKRGKPDFSSSVQMIIDSFVEESIPEDHPLSSAGERIKKDFTEDKENY